MQIGRDAAVALFVALGLKNAGRWNDSRIASKLKSLKDMVDEDVELDPEPKETLDTVMAAIDAGEDFEVVKAVEAGPAEEAATEEPTVEKEPEVTPTEEA